MKQCPKCLKEKPIDAFYKDAKAADGRTYNCKECRNKAHAAWVGKYRVWNQRYQRETKIGRKPYFRARAQNYYNQRTPEEIEMHRNAQRKRYAYWKVRVGWREATRLRNTKIPSGL